MSYDQNITCGQLADNVRPFLQKHALTLLAACLGLVVWILFSDQTAALAFLIIAAGSLLPVYGWIRQPAGSLPLGCLVGLQTLVIYGTPLIVHNKTVFVYPNEDILRAAIEVFIFCASLTGAWLFAFKNTHQRQPGTYIRFKFISTGHVTRLVSFGLISLTVSVGYHVASMSGLLSFLPQGVVPIIRTFADAAGVGGGLLSGYFIGIGAIRGITRLGFWSLFIVHCIFTSSDYTLFPVTALLIAVSIGVFLGRGRMPFFLLGFFALIIGFFNLSKFEMRNAHWVKGGAYAAQEIGQLPERYAEWARRSWGHITDAEEFKTDREVNEGQHVSNRINNLVNLLDVQSYVTRDHIAVLGGETYTVIPALLIPRILWPEKPRTHEGMILLNVYFGKQTLEDSFYTYISWGLLPEAYGNFGPFWGALFCGAALGLIIGWLESWSRYYPLTSLQALIFMSMLVQFGSSFEMVASLWVTSIFQMLVAMVGGTLPFVETAFFKTPDEE